MERPTGSMKQALEELATYKPSWIVTDGPDSWSVWHVEPWLHLVRRETEGLWASRSLWMVDGVGSISGTELTSPPGSRRLCRQCELLWDSLLLLPPDQDLVNGVGKASETP